MSVGHFYGPSIEKIFDQSIDLVGDTLKATLHGTGYAYDQAADEFFTEATDELSGTGYTAGGVTITGVAFNYVSGDLAMYVDMDDPGWVALTMTGIKYCVIRKDTGVDATSPLIAVLVNTVAQDSAGTDYSFPIPVGGLIAVGVS